MIAPAPVTLLIDAAGDRDAAALLPVTGLDRARDAASRAPGPWSGIYLERPLGGGGDRLDLLLVARRPLGAALEGWASIQELPGVSMALRYLTGWRSGDGLALVEFDLPAGARPRAGLMICIDAAFPERGLTPPAPAPATTRAALAAALVALGLDADPRALDAAAVCERLQPFGRPIHLSVMAGRPGAPLKLNVSLPRTGLTELTELTELTGLTGLVSGAQRDALETLLEALAPDLTQLKLDLRVSPGGPVGLELRYPPSDADAWGALAEALSLRGLCTGPEAAALAAWPGAHRQRLPGYGSPARVDRDLQIKLVVGDGPPRAKAYLGLRARFGLFL